jgi:hypothetical protein
MKSSAVSVSMLSPRESAPSFPSALPVVKKKESAQADVVAYAPAASSSTVKLTRDLMSLLRVDVGSLGLVSLDPRDSGSTVQLKGDL